MGESKYFIGIDAGTQGMRTGIFDGMGNVLSMNEEQYKTYYPEIGWAEQVPYDWFNSFKIALSKCLKAVSSESLKT